MRNIWRIFLADLKCLKTNVLAGVVVIGLLLTPSLYAWFNILGFWDPYSNTGNLKVAVANTDEGYKSTLFPVKVDAGQEIVSALHEDDNFDWTFVDKDQAIEGVRSGEYYAALVIPEDFSANLMTIFSGNVNQAEITYYTNQKVNAVAPKVTTEGATELSGEINQRFSQAVTEVGLATVNDLVDFVGGDGVENFGRNFEQQLGEMASGLGSAAEATHSLADLMNATGAVLEGSGAILGSVSGENAGISASLGQLQAAAEQGKGAVDAGGTGVVSALDDLSSGISAEMEKIEGSEVDSSVKEVIRERVEQIQGSIVALKGEISGVEGRTALLNEDFGATKQKIEGILGQIDHTATGLTESTRELSSNLYATGVDLESLGAQLTDSAGKLAAIQGDLRAALDSGDLAQVRKIIGDNPADLASFIAAPVELEKIPVYGVADNGSAMAPFYTSLSIWVGSIFLVALMETEVGKKRIAELEGKVTPAQLYLGRYLIFLLFALIQATIVCFGDMFFIGVQFNDIGLFFLTGWVCALVFSLIVYTLTLSFSRVGESLAIILVVLQVASAGGIFPVVLSAPVFQAIYPWMPFVYSMNAFQGAMAGVYGDQYTHSILTLLAFTLPMLVLGLVLRRPVIRLNNKMLEKLDETGVM